MHKLTQRYRYSFILLKQLVITDFKLRYQGSVLGYTWSLLRPLFLFGILYVIFARFLKFGGDMPHYPLYLLLGIVLWNYFAEVTSGSVGAIVGKSELLRKINFPKYVLILAGSFAAFINLILNFVIVGIFMALSGVTVSWNALLIIPLVIELFVISIALAFFLSSLFVKYRDISYIWEVIMQAAFYATPILYLLSMIPDKAAKVLLLSPVAQIMQDSRYVLVTDQTETIYQLYDGNIKVWAIPIGITILLAISSSIYFKKRSRFFAEEV